MSPLLQLEQHTRFLVRILPFLNNTKIIFMHFRTTDQGPFSSVYNIKMSHTLSFFLIFL